MLSPPAERSTQADVDVLAKYTLVLVKNNTSQGPSEMRGHVLEQLNDFLPDGERTPPLIFQALCFKYLDSLPLAAAAAREAAL